MTPTAALFRVFVHRAHHTLALPPNSTTTAITLQAQAPVQAHFAHSEPKRLLHAQHLARDPVLRVRRRGERPVRRHALILRRALVLVFALRCISFSSSPLLHSRARTRTRAVIPMVRRAPKVDEAEARGGARAVRGRRGERAGLCDDVARGERARADPERVQAQEEGEALRPAMPELALCSMKGMEETKGAPLVRRELLRADRLPTLLHEQDG